MTVNLVVRVSGMQNGPYFTACQSSQTFLSCAECFEGVKSPQMLGECDWLTHIAGGLEV